MVNCGCPAHAWTKYRYSSPGSVMHASSLSRGKCYDTLTCMRWGTSSVIDLITQLEACWERCRARSW